MKRTVFYSLVLCSVVGLFSQLVKAEIPKIISFQGVLKDAAGNPLSGTFQMKFRLYQTQTGGTATWGETQNVVVENGFYNVLLGKVESLANVPFNIPYWLEVEVGGNILSPRYELASSPYALGTKEPCLWTQSGSSIYPDNLAWNVGIGTDDPQANLHVRGMWAGKIIVDNVDPGWSPRGNKLWISAYDNIYGNLIYTENTINNRGEGFGIAGGSWMRPFPRFVVNATDTYIGWSIHPGDGTPAPGGNAAGNLYVRGRVGIGTKDPQKMLHIAHPTGGYNGLGIRLDPNLIGGISWNIDNDNGELKFIKHAAQPGYPKTVMILSNPSVTIRDKLGINIDNPEVELHVRGMWAGKIIVDNVDPNGNPRGNKLWISAYDSSYGNLIYTENTVNNRGESFGIAGGSRMRPFPRFVVNATDTYIGWGIRPGDGIPEIGGNAAGNLYVRGKVGIGTKTPDPDIMLHVAPIGGGTTDSPLLRLDNVLGSPPGVNPVGSIRIKIGGTIYKLAIYPDL